MFDSEYDYYLLDHKNRDEDSDILELWLYGFRTERRRYLVRGERYGNIKNSAYLLINRRNLEVENFRARAEEIFRKLYVNFE